MKKFVLLAAIATLVSMTVFAEAPKAVGETDPDCSRIKQTTPVEGGSAKGTPSAPVSGDAPKGTQK